MKQKSVSLGSIKYNSQKQMSPENNNIVYQYNRLIFPKEGDSSIFSEVGRRHFQKQDNKLLKIILPEKNNAFNSYIQRGNSLPPPHLQKHIFQDDLLMNMRKQDSREISNRRMGLRNKIQDQLDKLTVQFEAKKNSSVMAILQESPLKQSNKYASFQLKDKLANVLEQSRSSNSTSNESKLLYKIENKQKYDEIMQARSRNPTHLSTGLCII